MPIRSDINKTEQRYLLDMVDVQRGHTLEIGCGDGRLTWQYADRAQHITGIDVTLDPLKQALTQRPTELKHTVDFLAGSAIRMPFASASFDHVIFAWSF